MAKIEREIPNPLGLEAAKTKIASLVENLQKSYGAIFTDVKWNDDKTAAEVTGKGFKGNFTLTESALKIVADLGLAVSLFKGKIEQEIDSRTDGLLKADDTANA